MPETAVTPIKPSLPRFLAAGYKVSDSSTKPYVNVKNDNHTLSTI
jgi:hypothetical protein